MGRDESGSWSSSLDNGENRPEHPDEPTVWDWFISVLRRDPIPIPEEWGGPSLEMDDEVILQEIDSAVPAFGPAVADETPEQIDETTDVGRLEQSRSLLSQVFVLRKLRLPVAIFCALVAQIALEVKTQNLSIPAIFYLWAFVALILAVMRGDFSIGLPLEQQAPEIERRVRAVYLLPAAVLSALTFQISRSNEFSLTTLVLWGGALLFGLLAFWEGDFPFRSLWEKLEKVKSISFSFSAWNLVVLTTIGVVIFFRIHQLVDVPYEMWSDHAEKLLDVKDVLEGQTSIFFPRNTGREAIQFYLAAATIKLLGTGLSFITLKIGTVLIGLLALPYLYLFAKEYGGREVGLIAVFLTGIAYWPNVISRLGLRFPLYPLFVAPTLYYMVRGLRNRRRNDFILAGVAMGLGLHGYSPARTIPIVFTAGVLIYLIHHAKDGRQERQNTITWWALAVVIALIVFLPLLGVIAEMPDAVLGRMMSRMSSTEQSLPGSPINIFITNLWDALRMFSWDEGEIWVVSIPHRPALDWVTGAFFGLGVVLVLVRIIRDRRWEDTFLLLSIPLLMLPSILSLAFPGENPAPNRASGAIVPVFAVAAIAVAIIPKWIEQIIDRRSIRVAGLSAFFFLMTVAAWNNYHLVFDTFADQHRKGTWNTREVGAFIRGFATSIGSYETAHVIAYPHWLDTRLVGINAGVPGVDYGIWPDQLEALEPTNELQLFIFNQDDELAQTTLLEMYPNGELKRIQSFEESRDFMVFTVPARSNALSESSSP